MLSDKKIIRARERGDIIISPFNRDHLGPNSYDCTLGLYYYEESLQFPDIFIDSQESINKMWHPPRAADTVMYNGVPFIPIDSGAIILAHTEEVIGGRNGYVGMMGSKSTVARLGLSVCRCAGVGDVGYISRWTMEICNHTKSRLWLPIGMKICQISFHCVGKTTIEYSGNYQKDIWKPENMLPNISSIMGGSNGYSS